MRYEMDWERLALWLMGISGFMFLIAIVMAPRNGIQIMEALALAVTCAGMMTTVGMAYLTIFPRGNNTSADNLRKTVIRNARYTGVSMIVTAAGMGATLMLGIIPL